MILVIMTYFGDKRVVILSVGFVLFLKWVFQVDNPPFKSENLCKPFHMWNKCQDPLKRYYLQLIPNFKVKWEYLFRYAPTVIYITVIYIFS